MLIDISIDNAKMTLPIHHNHLLQSFIYHNIDAELANQLHEKGYMLDGRSFRMFTFSRLKAPFVIDQNKGLVSYQTPITWKIASPINFFCETFIYKLMTKEELFIGSERISVGKFQCIDDRMEKNAFRVRALSPIVAYSTMIKSDGDKYTYYFHPGEKDYAKLVSGNLKRKYKAFYGKEPPEGEVRIKSAFKDPKFNLVKYEGGVIKGYSGDFFISGPQELLQLGISAGFGSKNAQGFGMVEVIN